MIRHRDSTVLLAFDRQGRHNRYHPAIGEKWVIFSSGREPKAAGNCPVPSCNNEHASNNTSHRRTERKGANLAILGVNIDHVATVREARKTNEPDPVWAA